ncbi:MAG: 2-hydroxyacid dehydrogenase [Alphaproteobacteria bacterium]
MALLYFSAWDDRGLWERELKALDPTLDIRTLDNLGDAAEIDAALVWKPDQGLLASLPNLKLIASLGMGVDHIFADPLLPKGVPIVRMVDDNLVDQMSEWVLLNVLRYHRAADRYDADQSAQLWRPGYPPDTGARRIGVMGLGAIGLDAATKLAKLGFAVAGWSRTLKHVPGIECHAGAAGFAAFLRRTEYLICLLPLTPETDSIIDATLLAQLPKGAVVFNAARGGHVVEEDLLAALESGHLSAACLDVFRTEPLPKEHPFWRHPKVRMTPHNAGLTNPKTAAAQVIENLRRLRTGEPLRNLVGRERGY